MLHHGRRVVVSAFTTSSLHPVALSTRTLRRRIHASTGAAAVNNTFFDPETPDFESLGIKSPILLQRLRDNLRIDRPTAVQAAAFSAIAGQTGGDVTVGAETGTGKTLAYLLPLIDDILERKAKKLDLGYTYARALILVPNKELVQQVVRMAIGLTGGKSSIVFSGSMSLDKTIKEHESSIPPADQIVRLAVLPGGLYSPRDFEPFRKAPPPVDLVISTPASVGPLGLSPRNMDLFTDIPTVVVDEADMLLDGGYIRQLENVFMGFRRADRWDKAAPPTQHVFVAATLPDYGLRSVDAYLRKKFPHSARVTLDGMHNARHSGLQEATTWIEEESKKERMMQLVSMLGEDEKVMVFLNTVGEVEAATQALLRNGKNALAYHAKIPLDERPSILDRFRRFQPGSSASTNECSDRNDADTAQILVCTDLASRGLDIPGVTTVVQLQFSTNVVAHLHRMGRCGRAGRKTGRGIVFYGQQESELVQAVRAAEDQQNKMVLEQDVLEIDVGDDEEGTVGGAGKVTKAFSRKRGFRKKRKKLAQASSEQ